MIVRDYVSPFVRKFVLDVLPGTLASLLGAMFVAHYWSQPAPRVDVQLASQSEEIARMVRDEHALMVEFLKREQERETARQPLTIGDMKTRETALVAARRAPGAPVRDAKATTQPMPAPRPVASVPARAAEDVVAVESGPLAAPDPEPVGAIGHAAAWAHSWTDKAIDLTGLRQVPALVRILKQDAAGDDLRSDARLAGVPR